MSQLHKLFPKDNFLFVVLYTLSMCMVLFGLSWNELLRVVIIDSLAFATIFKLDKIFFYKLFPRYALLKDLERSIKDTGNSLPQQNELFQTLADFPKVRCFYVFWISFIKVLPAGLYIAFVSNTYEWPLQNLILFYGAAIFVFFYFQSLLFIELHVTTSNIMGELRHRGEWEGNYRGLKLKGVKDKFSSLQNAVMFSMLFNLLFLTLFILDKKLQGVDAYLCVLFSSAVICIGNVQFRFQHFFNNALKSMFELLEEDMTTRKLQLVPLHTSPLLAGFEHSFNQLGLKLEQRDQEISLWLKHEAEQFHYRSLGEVVGLVAHDIKTPLDVMQMSLDMMKDPSISPEERAKYELILERNLSQTISFSKTLMAYLRGEREGTNCMFTEVHQHLLDLFRSQFIHDDLAKIQFDMASELSHLYLSVSRLNAMHIFYNLYQNAIKALIKHKCPAPKICLRLEMSKEDSSVTIFIFDNGPGLSVEAFQQMVSFERFQTENFYHGLGLRLTNMLLNHLNGSLDIVPTSKGTCLSVKMPAFVPHWQDEGEDSYQQLLV